MKHSTTVALTPNELTTVIQILMEKHLIDLRKDQIPYADNALRKLKAALNEVLTP